MPLIHITGAGPAGSSAALAALGAGADVRITDRSRFPRHKVCGEFLSPEIQPMLKELGVWSDFLAAEPAIIRRLVLSFGVSETPLRREAPLPRPAWGLSRWTFDQLLLDAATRRGARFHGPDGPQAQAETRAVAEPDAEIVAHGRRAEQSRRGNRLFGFKAHFSRGSGSEFVNRPKVSKLPPEDAVELYFFDGCYIGVNAIESNKINVCGLASEGFLSRFAFQYDTVVEQCPSLRGRLNAHTRDFPWISVGPLEFRQRFGHGFVGAHVPRSGPPVGPGRTSAPYPAGDALSFVDPFTGSGLLAAVKTGSMAGRAAALGEPVETYLRRCRASLRQPFLVSSILRRLVSSGWVEWLAPCAPSQLLFSLTRPR